MKKRKISATRKRGKNNRAGFYIALASLSLVIFLVTLFIQINKATTGTLPVRAQSAQDTTPLTAPTNLIVKGNLASARSGGSRDDLTWSLATDSAKVSSYLVYQIVNSSVYDPNPLAEVQTTSYSRQFSVDGYATDYSYYVVAKDTSGNVSPKSNIAHMTGIWGDVLDSTTNRYIRGAQIKAVGNGTSSTYVANYAGAYLLNLSPGDYTVTYSASGYKSQQFTLTVVTNKMTGRNVFLVKSKR